MVNRFNGQSGVKFATANPSGGGPPHSKAASPQKFGIGRWTPARNLSELSFRRFLCIRLTTDLCNRACLRALLADIVRRRQQPRPAVEKRFSPAITKPSPRRVCLPSGSKPPGDVRLHARSVARQSYSANRNKGRARSPLRAARWNALSSTRWLNRCRPANICSFDL